MEDDTPTRASNIKTSIRAIHREMMEISQLLGNGDSISKNQANMRMANLEKLAKSVLLVLDKWEQEIEADEADRRDFIESVTKTIQNIDTFNA